MAFLGLLFFLPVLLTIAFMVGVVPGGALVLLILSVRRWRRSRTGWLIVKVYCGGLALFAVGCLPIAAILVSDLLGDIAAPYYHYTLDTPRKFDRVTFPAGSEIEVSPFPPHHVLRGHLGAPTTIAGLRLVGDFAMTDDFAMPRGTVGSGDLAEPHDINVLPCGIGRFSHNIAFVYCNLVRDVRISGFLLRAGVPARVKASENDTIGPDIDATLAEPTHVGRFDCAPGPFTITKTGASCLLAARQNIDGYILQAGSYARFDRIDSDENWLTGTLAQPLNIDGVVLPAGTVMERGPPGPADTMRDHVFTEGENAWFIVADNATVAVHGGHAQSGMSIEFSAGGLSVTRRDANDPGFFVLDGERTAWAHFDNASGKWDLHR